MRLLTWGLRRGLPYKNNSVLSTIFTVFIVEYDDIFSFVSVSSILIYFILNVIKYTVDEYLYRIKE